MNIREVRRAKNMTQSELAKEVGVSPTVISRYEKGSISPPISKLKLISKTLGVSLSDFLRDESALSIGDYTDRNTQKNEKTHLLMSILADHMDSLGFCLEEVQETGFANMEKQYVVADAAKKWQFFIVPGDLVDEGFISSVLNSIGFAVFHPSISKLSIVSNHPCEDIVKLLPSSQCTKQISFDLSLIYIDLAQEKVAGEYELATHYDGTGFYDLIVSGREVDSARELAKWKSSLIATS